MAFPFLVHSFPLGLSERSQMHYWQQGKEPLPMQPGPKWLLAGIGFWSLAYVVSRLLCPRRSKDFCNRLVSMLHVALSLLLCGISVRDWSHPLDGIGGPSTFPQMVALTVSLAYFIYDSLCCLVELPFKLEDQIHHAITIMGLAYGYLLGSCGTELVACLMLMELSNPFMHARELLKELNLKDTSYSFLNDVCFASVFTFARMIVGPFVVFFTVQADGSPAVKVGAVGIQLVSILWFWRIARMVLYKLKKRNLKPKSS